MPPVIDTPFLYTGLGGASAAAGQAWRAPASAHPRDIEFKQGEDLSSWLTVNDSSTAESASYPDYFTATGTDDGDRRAFGNDNPEFISDWLQYQAAKPGTSTGPAFFGFDWGSALPTNLLMYARGYGWATAGANSDDGDFGLFLAADLSGNPDRDNSMRLYGLKNDAGAYYCRFEKLVAGSVSGGTTDTDALENVPHYGFYALHKVGSTVHSWSGSLGRSWSYLGSRSISGTMRHVGLMFRNTVQNPEGNRVCGVDFLRFLETDSFVL